MVTLYGEILNFNVCVFSNSKYVTIKTTIVRTLHNQKYVMFEIVARMMINIHRVMQQGCRL